MQICLVRTSEKMMTIIKPIFTNFATPSHHTLHHYHYLQRPILSTAPTFTHNSLVGIPWAASARSPPPCGTLPVSSSTMRISKRRATRWAMVSHWAPPDASHGLSERRSSVRRSSSSVRHRCHHFWMLPVNWDVLGLVPRKSARWWAKKQLREKKGG